MVSRQIHIDFKGRTRFQRNHIRNCLNNRRAYQCEVISLESEGMIKEAIEIAAWHPNIVVKIPMTWEGLKATSNLVKKV